MRVLLVCESFSAKLSGGRVARYLHKILSEHRHEVAVAVTGQLRGEDADGADGGRNVISLPPGSRAHRLYSLLDTQEVPSSLQRLISDFAPEVAHFASFDQTKSSNIYYYCKLKGIKTVLQPWTMHFYCAQGFGFRENRNCFDCIEKGFSAAFANRCTGPRGIIGQIERNSLRKCAVQTADILLSSNGDLDNILVSYGIEKRRIVRFPIVFDTGNVTSNANANAKSGDYYIYYGQTVTHKGIDFILDVFSQLSQHRLKIYPMAPFSPKRPLPQNIEILNGFGWDNGLSQAISSAKAVLVPSLWTTSTEYSLCEAMTLKKPVIAFNVGAHKELLSNRRDAMVVDPGDKLQFAAALNELKRDQALCDRLGAAGAARIAEVNDPEKLHEQLISAYKHLGDM